MTVIVDVDNQYCEELCYSYQITQGNDGTYTVYQSWDIFKGRYLGRNLETLEEAWSCLNRAMVEYEQFSEAV